ncbi:hypothetical protein [Micromonospora sp. NPDC023814]|uniref:hypothetical protein n=1 Tax=Micromonospora sp. NPDC023814 TaxID=3154596 RepID=UPI0033FEB35B
MAFPTGSRGAKAVGPLGRVPRDAAPPLFARRVARDGGASLAWLYDHHVDRDAKAVA